MVVPVLGSFLRCNVDAIYALVSTTRGKELAIDDPREAPNLLTACHCQSAKIMAEEYHVLVARISEANANATCRSYLELLNSLCLEELKVVVDGCLRVQ